MKCHNVRFPNMKIIGSICHEQNVSHSPRIFRVVPSHREARYVDISCDPLCGDSGGLSTLTQPWIRGVGLTKKAQGFFFIIIRMRLRLAPKDNEHQ